MSAVYHPFGLDDIDLQGPLRMEWAANQTESKEESITMASNKTLVPEAKQALNQFKMEAANEVGVNLNQGYNGDLTSRQAGSIGGQMVKKMIQSYENNLSQQQGQ